MIRIDTSDWKKFKLDEILKKVETKKIPLKKGDCFAEPNEEYSIPARTATVSNQGLSCYVPRSLCTVLKNKISVSANGDFCAFWHDSEFTILQDAYALEGNGFELTKNIALFLISIMNHNFSYKYNWNNKSGWEKLKHEEILIPIDDSEKINFKYMEERIAELEEERIAELEQYLIATGLNDYQLTEEDIRTLSLYQKWNNEEPDCKDAGRIYKEYKLNELGKIVKVKGLPFNSYPCGSIPYVTGTQYDNGVVGYVTAPPESISDENCIVIDPIRGFCMYQPDKFVGRGFSGASVNALYIDGLNKLRAMYIISVIERVSTKVANYGNLFNSNKLLNAKVCLPSIMIDNKYIPDWDYMEKYIRAIEKIVIADVVKYKDNQISITKQLVQNACL